MNKYVNLPRDRFIAMMQERGFGVAEDQRSGELVFTRRNHNNHDLVVKVYSSIPIHASVARDCGEDAIRVLACYDPPKGKGKFRKLEEYKVLRVNSVDGILERTLQRMRDAYADTNKAFKHIGRAISTLEVVA